MGWGGGGGVVVGIICKMPVLRGRLGTPELVHRRRRAAGLRPGQPGETGSTHNRTRSPNHGGGTELGDDDISAFNSLPLSGVFPPSESKTTSAAFVRSH